MKLSVLLFQLAVLLGLVLVASMFATSANTGGSVFDECWPYLAPPAFVLALLSLVSEFLSRKYPDAWIFRSAWPPSILVGLLVSSGALLLFGSVG